MDGFTLGERLKTIFETIFSSSFFITLLVILVFTITILIINAKVKSKAPKIIAITSYILLMILVLARYGGYVLAINDSVVDKFFKAMYFPNLVVYLSMLLISLLLLALNFVDTHYTQMTKLFNIICFALIWFFFVLVLDSAKNYGINIYEITDIYSNSTMMILLQASMCVFFVWLGILIMNFVVRKLTYKLDNKPKSNEYDMNSDYSYSENNEISNNYQDYNLNEQNNSYINQGYEMNNYQNSNNYVGSSYGANTNNTIDNNFNNDSYQGINGYNNTNNYNNYSNSNNNFNNNNSNSNISNNNTYNNVSNSYGNYSNTNYQNSDYNNNYGQNNSYQSNNNYDNIDTKTNNKKSIINIFKRNKSKDNDDEIMQFSDEDFKNSYLNMQKYDQNDEINQIMDNKRSDS